MAVWRFTQNCVGTAGDWIGTLLIATLLLLSPILPTQADDAQYIYDPGGRLIGMIDPVNGSATYNYDKAGNITSITQRSATTMGVLQFFPQRGPVGTSVTISGTALMGGTTTVQFGSVTATPTSVTANNIVVPVPAGASGAIPITITTTSPSGTYTTPGSFTVQSPPAAPTITSFSPTTQAQDSTITVTGTNFDTANSKAYINGQAALITAATASSLTVKVPLASSGRVTVQTPNGSITHTTDLIVPPPGYTAAMVQDLGRTTLGAAPTTQNISPNKVSLLLFDVVAGQTISAYAFAPNSGAENIAIVDQSGALAYRPIFSTTNNWFGPFTASRSGTYSVQLTSTTYTGPITTTLYNVLPPATGTVALDGTTAVLSIPTPGQQGILTFDNTVPNRKVTIHVDFGGMGSKNTYSIMNPDQSTYLVPPTDTSGQFWQDNAIITLAQTGTYTFRVQPDLDVGGSSGSGFGSFAVNIFTVPPDVTGDIPLDGTTQTFNFATPGQQGLFTFNNNIAANLRTTIFLDFGGLVSNHNVYSIQAPNGSFLVPSNETNQNGFFQNSGVVVLPQTGIYKVRVSPNFEPPIDSGTGQFAATIFQVPADATATLTIGGGPQSVPLTTPGQAAKYSFSGNSGQKISLNLNFDAMSSCGTFSLKRANGTVVIPDTHTCTNSFVATLPATDTYNVPIVFDTINVITMGKGTMSASVANSP